MNRKIYPKKSLGQNFLIDNNIINMIVNALDIIDNEPVLEIGPGIGALTYILLQRTQNLILIEKDSELSKVLSEKFPHITVINEDFLDFHVTYTNVYKVVGNLPYNVATQIIFKILRNYQVFQKGVFMVQKEVADRIIANNNCKDFSLLSVIVQTFAKPSKLFNVSPNCFKPRPKVVSTVFGLDISNRFAINDFDKFFLFVKALFYGRRKKLVNVFKNNPFLTFNDVFTDYFMEQFGKDTRINDLTVSDIVSLYKKWSKTNEK